MEYDATELNKEIVNALIYCGVPANYVGYDYLKEGVRMAVEDPRVVHNMTKMLYPAIAEKFGETPSRVERGIRHAVERVFLELPPKYAEECFGGCIRFSRGKLTNSEFIAIIAERIREGIGPWKQTT